MPRVPRDRLPSKARLKIYAKALAVGAKVRRSAPNVTALNSNENPNILGLIEAILIEGFRPLRPD